MEMPGLRVCQIEPSAGGRAGTSTLRHHDAFKSLSRLERRVTNVADVAGLARVGLMHGTDTAA